MCLNKLVSAFFLFSSVALVNIAFGYEFPVVVSQGHLPEQNTRMWPSQIHPDLLAKGFETIPFGEGVELHQLVPAEAKLGWKLEIIDLSVNVGPHYHKIQNHLLVILEGQLEITCEEKNFTLGPSQSITIPAGTSHTLKPQQGSVRLLALDMPGLTFPVDSYEPPSSKKGKSPVVISHSDLFVNCTIRLPAVQKFSELDAAYYHAKTQLPQGSVYTLIPSFSTKDKWSVEVLEVDSLKDFQPKATKLIAVLDGEMELYANNVRYCLKPGQSVRIPPDASHNLHSKGHPVRLLCITFP